MTLILGIDPGSRKTGFGVIRVERNQAQYVSSGTIRLPVKEALGARLRVLFESLSEIIDTYQPTVRLLKASLWPTARILRSSWVTPGAQRWLPA